MVVVANTTVTDTTGYEPRGDVSEVVFFDANGNGTLDAGEALADIDVTVTIDGTPTTYTTDTNGTVTITGLLAGTTVTFDVDTTDTDFPTGAVLTVGSDPTDVVVVANTTDHRHDRLRAARHRRRGRVPRQQRQRPARPR